MEGEAPSEGRDTYGDGTGDGSVHTGQTLPTSWDTLWAQQSLVPSLLLTQPLRFPFVALGLLLLGTSQVLVDPHL